MIKTINLKIEKPYFSNTDISFINFDFKSASDKFVYPEKVKLFLKELLDNYTGYNINIIDGNVKMFLVSKIPDNFNDVFISDGVMCNIILEGIIKDYFKEDVIKVFEQEMFTDTTKLNIIFELNRYNDWIVSMGGRTVKDEIIYRFGFHKNEFKND